MRAWFAASLVLIAVAPAPAWSVDEALAAGDFPYRPVTTYSVLRNGQPIGQHTLRFEQRGAERVVTIAINFDVKLLGVTAYRFVHQGREVWRGDHLQSLETSSDNNGRRYTVRARGTPAGLVVDRESSGEVANSAAAVFSGFAGPERVRETLPVGTLPSSFWNLRQVQQSLLLNTSTGKPSRLQITPMGRETVRIASGNVQATRYRYSGDLKLDQWFDDRGRWVRMSFVAFEGSRIEYILQE